MASTKLMETKDGKKFYKISVSRGHGKAAYTKRWYVPEGHARRTVERELLKAVAEFERACAAGEVETRQDRKVREKKEAEEAAKLKTFRQYAEGVFMATKGLTLSENGRSSYQMFLDKHIFPALGDTLLVDISTAMVTKLLTDFQGKGYAHATCVKLYNILNGVFEMAFLDDSIPMNPMLKVKRPAQSREEQQEKSEVEALTVEELNHVLSCVAQEPLKWRVYITLAADSGGRRGELCGLKWADIDFDNGTMTISRSLNYTKAKGVYTGPTKGGKSRTIDVGPEVLNLLQRLRAEQSGSCISQWVFTQDHSPEPMFPQSPTKYFKKFGERYGVPNFHPHLLRHTSASIGITHGADVASVSERLGHADKAVTLKMYTHSDKEGIRRAGDIVRNALKAQNS